MNSNFTPDSTRYVVQGRSICKQFAGKQVLTNVDIDIEAGALYALLGPNGAGKSTLISILTGVARADSGELTILGRHPEKESLEVKRRIGIVPEELTLFERLTGYQQLIFCGRMYGLSTEETEKRADELLRLTDLKAAESQLIATYSKGMRRRLAIAAALIHGPELVFLDEPFDGIDVVAAAVIRELLQELLRAETTILLTTHILPIADRLATHAGVLNDGRIVEQGDKQHLLTRHKSKDLEGVFEALVPLPAVKGVELSYYQTASSHR